MADRDGCNFPNFQVMNKVTCRSDSRFWLGNGGAIELRAGDCQVRVMSTQGDSTEGSFIMSGFFMIPGSPSFLKDEVYLSCCLQKKHAIPCIYSLRDYYGTFVWMHRCFWLLLAGDVDRSCWGAVQRPPDAWLWADTRGEREQWYGWYQKQEVMFFFFFNFWRCEHSSPPGSLAFDCWQHEVAMQEKISSCSDIFRKAICFGQVLRAVSCKCV